MTAEAPFKWHGTHCWLSYQTQRADKYQRALIEMRTRAASLRGEQAYREFPSYVANAVKAALQVKGREG